MTIDKVGQDMPPIKIPAYAKGIPCYIWYSWWRLV